MSMLTRHLKNRFTEVLIQQEVSTLWTTRSTQLVHGTSSIAQAQMKLLLMGFLECNKKRNLKMWMSFCNSKFSFLDKISQRIILNALERSLAFSHVKLKFALCHSCNGKSQNQRNSWTKKTHVIKEEISKTNKELI